MDTLPRSGVRVALAEHDEAFAVAALHLQHDVAAGARPEPGFIDRYADWWLPRREDRPTWLAKGPAGDPWGVLDATFVAGRPRVGRASEHRVVVEFVHVVPAHRRTGIASALLGACVAWAGVRAAGRVEAGASAPGAGALLVAAGFTSAGDTYRRSV